MCYNSEGKDRKRCKITLFGEEKIIADGFLEQEEGGFRLKYFSDGDEFSLSFMRGRVTYSRRGSLRLSLELKEGENTACILYEGENTGKIPVHTSLVRAVSRSDGWELLLKYTVGGVAERLRLTAVTEKENEN